MLMGLIIGANPHRWVFQQGMCGVHKRTRWLRQQPVILPQHRSGWWQWLKSAPKLRVLEKSSDLCLGSRKLIGFFLFFLFPHLSSLASEYKMPSVWAWASAIVARVEIIRNWFSLA